MKNLQQKGNNNGLICPIVRLKRKGKSNLLFPIQFGDHRKIG
jgi:hypothetical protein